MCWIRAFVSEGFLDSFAATQELGEGLVPAGVLVLQLVAAKWQSATFFGPLHDLGQQ